MSGALVFAAVLVGTVVWALLPFIPAIRELLRPTDATPLGMVGRDSGDITYFATGFRGFLERNPRLVDGDDSGEALGTLGDGSPFARVSSPDAWSRLPRGPHGEIVSLVVLDAPIATPPGEMFAAELYARQPMRGGAGTTYRAVLADDACHLAPESVVTRWIHTAGPLYVGRDSTLYNRASSDDSITLSRDVRFDRLGAPLIEVAASAPRPPAVEERLVPLATPPRALVVDGGGGGDGAPASTPYYRVDGDLELPAGTVLRGNLVVRGAFVIRRGARLEGSVKAHDGVVVEEGGTVTAAVVSRTGVTLGPSTSVGGPLIAEGDTELGPWGRIGDASAPTTVACRRLTVAYGSRIHGRVTTRDGGMSRNGHTETPADASPEAPVEAPVEAPAEGA